MKKILVIDDQGHLLQEEGFSDFFPDADVRTVQSYHEAEELYDDGFLPDIISTDCFDTGNYDRIFGVRNARRTIEYFAERNVSQPLPIFFFKSSDPEMAESARHMVLDRHPETESYAIDVAEMSLARDLYKNKRSIDDRDAETTGFREFLKKHLGITLPMNDDEIDAYLLHRGDLEPEDVVDLVEKGKFNRNEALALIGEEAVKKSNSRYSVSVDIYGREDYDEIKDLSSTFSQAVGQPVNGYAAFNKTDVKSLLKEGKKPVLFLKHYTTSFIPYLGDLAGIVLLDAGLSGHMKILLASHGVAGALGAKDMASHFPFLRMSDGKPVRETKDIRGRGRNRVFTDFERALYKPGNNHIEKHLTDGWDDDEILKTLPPLILSDDSLKPHSRIKYGDPVTIVTNEGFGSEVWPLHLDIRDGEFSRIYEWTSAVERWLDDWHKEQGISLPQFKANVDSPHQGYQGSGIGLLRTEHFILTSEEQQKLFKQAVLGQDKKAFFGIQRALCEDLKRILYPVSDSFPVRIRLADMPPVEVFDKGELSRFERQYGNDNIRGVQLAERLPALYEAQIRGIFEAVLEGRDEEKKIWGRDDRDVSKARPEIMVPTVRTVDELRFVKAMIAKIAEEFGFSANDYSFGSMLETKDACHNIEEIVAECDFMSIGSNDLTEEILGCARHDYAARNKVMSTYKKVKDPFLSLYEPVVDTVSDAVLRARNVKPEIQIDFCGAHAEDLESLKALEPLKLSSVSLPPTDNNMRTLYLAYSYSSFEKYSSAENRPPANPPSVPPKNTP